MFHSDESVKICRIKIVLEIYKSRLKVKKTFFGDKIDATTNVSVATTAKPAANENFQSMMKSDKVADCQDMSGTDESDELDDELGSELAQWATSYTKVGCNAINWNHT